MLGSIECKQSNVTHPISRPPLSLGLGTLQNLVMLNIANNNIRTIAALDNCRALQSLDASSNSIQQLEDLSHAVSLKVSSFSRLAPAHIPRHFLVPEFASEFHSHINLGFETLAKIAAHTGHFQ